MGRLLGKIIGKSEIDGLLRENPTINPLRMAQRLGVHISTMNYALQHYGYIEKKSYKTYHNPNLTEEEIHQALKENPFLTLEEMSELLGASVSTIERVRRNGDFKSLPKGRRIPYTYDEIKQEILYLISQKKMNRKDIAEYLKVSPPTITNYVNRLKGEGLLPVDFSFKKK